MIEFWDWVEANIKIILFIVIAFALCLAFVRSRITSSKDGPSGVYLPKNIADIVSITDDLSNPVRVRQVFNSVFFDKRTRASMIAHYKAKHHLTNDVDAMRYAIKDRENDGGRWR
jgi:hypothetical protein